MGPNGHLLHEATPSSLGDVYNTPNTQKKTQVITKKNETVEYIANEHKIKPEKKEQKEMEISSPLRTNFK